MQRIWIQRSLNVLLALALGLALLSGWLLWRAAENGPAGIETAPGGQIGGPFALVDQNGHAKTDRDFHRRWVLLYFGYTYCPDVCPTTLALEEKALRQMGTQAAKVTPVFVSVDPDRDTPAVLKTYLAAFGPAFVGLTGKPDAIAKVAHSYRVYYAKHPLAGGAYAVDHSSVIYLLDPKGRFVKVYDDDISAQALSDDLKKQIASA